MQGNVPGSSGSSVTYDVRDEAHTVALLKLVRHSLLDNETKDDIRDVLFEIRNNGDDSLIQELQLYVDPLNVEVVYGQNGTESVEASPQETIKLKVNATQTSPVAESVVAPIFEEKVPVSVIGRTRPVPAVTRSTAPSIDTAYKAEIVPEVVQETFVPHEIEVPESVPEPTQDEVVPEPVVLEAPIETTMSVPMVETSPTVMTPESAQARITEIKHVVNAAVGNPVNLIDADNTLGREYMNALLTAMKAVSAGGATLEGAMQQLEQAFAAVEPLLAHVQIEVDEPAQTEAVQPEPMAAIPEIEHTKETVVSEAPSITELPPFGVTHEEQKVETPEPVHVPEAPAQSVASIAARWQADEQAHAPKEKVLDENADPLYGEQVTAGLKQLLNEWKYFKSSGVFGTGPHGIDHPLFKEIKNLNMNLVITGRFEGATPDVRQSITDYMNGWRYEQGMTHDMQETFEHYLRRVIKAIIDKRPTTSPS